MMLGTQSSAQADNVWTLSTDSVPSSGSDYAPTLVGNGYFGTRIPPDGQGYSSSPVATETHIAGTYLQTVDTRGMATVPGFTTVPIAAPSWTGLTLSDGSQTFTTSAGTVLSYRQALDMLDGVLSTSVLWRAGDGNVTQLTYEVIADQQRAHVGVVRMRFTPQWSGNATVQDVLGPGAGINGEEGIGPTLPLALNAGSADPATATNRYQLRAPDGTVVAETSRLLWSSAVTVTAPVAVMGTGTSALQVSFPVTAGRTYELDKVVGLSSSSDASAAVQTADQESASAAAAGPAALFSESSGAWRGLWASRVDVTGDAESERRVLAQQYYLLTTVRPGVDTSTSPGGLSSGGYNGHVFWDADTWMFPSLLAMHPDQAHSMVAYRDRLLGAATAYAQANGTAGARYPWESARSGGEEAPPPWGVLEQHISSDVALAQWQYFMATGDRNWLAQEGWPVLSAVANFWVSRVTKTARGYEIDQVMPPDENHFPVNNSAYTNASAELALRFALQAASLLGKSAPASWSTVADAMYVPFDASQGIHPEFDSYSGDAIKQADVVMLTYPWEFPMAAQVAAADLNYYAPRSSTSGPSMTDAMHSIVAATLNLPGCADYTYLRRASDPFLQAPFEQFHETRSGGTFTFLTAVGGYLQTYIYGFSGLRWRVHRVGLDPTLPPQLPGVALRGVHWQGRMFTVDIGPENTHVVLDSGAPMTLAVRGVSRTLAQGHPLDITTRRPDLAPTSDLARCRPARATQPAADEYPMAAVDGSAVTAWVPSSSQDALIVDLGSARDLTGAVLQWDGVRPSAYTLDASSDGQHWHGVAEVTSATGATDHLSFATAARYVRLTEQVSSNGAPALAELSITGPAIPAPQCSLTPSSTRVKLRGLPRRAVPTSPLVGALALVARCNQDARISVTGRLTERPRRRAHGAGVGARRRAKIKAFALATPSTSVPAKVPVALTVKLPKVALKGLKKKAREAATFTLAATNSSGATSTTRANLTRITAARGRR
jgi:trehalose/maltose hydrolase-like predicted phosphorylase